MKVIIAGSRYFTDYDLLKEKCDRYLSRIKPDVVVISGRCPTGTHTFTTDEGIKVFGADGLGEQYAKENGFIVEPYPADWGKYGKSAGPIRNTLMANEGECLILFGEGTGSSSMKDAMKRLEKPIREITY